MKDIDRSGNSRTLVIGDVHGCNIALENLLDQVAPAKDDTIVVLGDLIDRGPNSKAVVDRVLGLREHCNLVYVMGNHEEMLRGSLEGTYMLAQWMHFGGQATLESYGDVTDIPAEHLRFLFGGSDYYETEDHIFVHACLETEVTMINQRSEFLRWKHLGGSEPPHPSGKRVICGHTAQSDGRPLVFDGWVCIDTYAYGNGWLSCMDIDSNHIYQANQQGVKRDFPLDPVG